MSTAKKYDSKRNSMSVQSRRKAYAAINILWAQMRPDLKFESKNILREERLAWIAGYLGLKNLNSTTQLTDGQIGFVLDEMKRMTGQNKTIVQSKRDNVVSVDFTTKKLNTNQNPEDSVTVHLSSEAQQITLTKLSDYIYGDDIERLKGFLTARKFATNFKMLPFKKATALTMILLNIAAQKDLKKAGLKTGRKETAKHIPIIKKKLRIDL